MRYYPVFLDIKGRPCTVVGGGTVAERKVITLVSSGAKVTVISPRLTEKLQGLVDKKKIRYVKRGYRKGDLKGAFVAISASNSKEVNESAYREALAEGVLINSVDDPGHCSFIVPSVIERGSLLIAISTSGAIPALAKRLRLDIERLVGEEYGKLTEILGAVRKKLLKSGANRVKKERVIGDLAKSPLPGLIRKGAVKEINAYLKGLLGEGFTLGRLGVSLEGPAVKTVKKVKKTP